MTDHRANAAAQLLETYEATGDKKFLEAAKILDPEAVRAAGYAVGQGRPKSADSRMLLWMAEMMHRDGWVYSRAAKEAAERKPGYSFEATFDRLRRKFRKGEPDIQQEFAADPNWWMPDIVLTEEHAMAYERLVKSDYSVQRAALEAVLRSMDNNTDNKIQ